MSARIYRRLRSSTQSGRAREGQWVLEHESAERKHADPLTGWTASNDTREQIRLSFETLEAARAYAEKYGIDYHVVPPAERSLKLQTYADNFK